MKYVGRFEVIDDSRLYSELKEEGRRRIALMMLRQGLLMRGVIEWRTIQVDGHLWIEGIVDAVAASDVVGVGHDDAA